MPENLGTGYGWWPSEISAASIASASVRLASVLQDGDAIYWLEGRPQEQGRTVIVRYQNGKMEDILPAPFNARSRVHEYGGGAYTVHDGHCWFVNDKDQQVYHCHQQQVKQITNEAGCRYADLQYHVKHQTLYAVREAHRQTGDEPTNELVQIDCKSNVVTVVASGDDFYSAPAISPDGKHLAWISWQHPNMPWDETRLWVAIIDASGDIQNVRCVLQQTNQAIFQPLWSPDGRLYFVNDPQGWWQLYRFNDVDDAQSIEQVCDYPAEMGLPLWQFGMQTYGFQRADKIVATICEQGLWRMVTICANTGEVEPIASPYNSFSALAVGEQQVSVIAAGATRADEVACYSLSDRKWSDVLAPTAGLYDEGWYSQAQAISFPTTDNAKSHGFYYPPLNAAVNASDDGLPPLLVMSHGGPTGATSPSLNLKIQFWTSRGFAVLDVNYRGSTGYGRHYRDLLKGQWGIYDVDDVVAGARYLVDQGLVDNKRLAIRGSSAGGYTTLAALTFRDDFSMGASFYGISELESLAKDTHKFEARYLDRLVGEYPAERQTYLDRSPLHHTDQLSCPIIFMQGAEDKVVPPAQAQMMVEQMQQKGIDCELLMFEGEQHGFRKAETIEQSLSAELNFYQRHFA